MQEQLGKPQAPAPDDTLGATLEKRNRELAAYFDHWATAGACANEIRQLTGDSENGIDAVLGTLAEIEQSLDVIHGYFTELGHIPEHNGDFDADSLMWAVIERKIGNGKIRTLDDFPEALREDFRYLFEGDELLYVERPRDSEAIRIDLDDERGELDGMLGRPHDFSDFVPDRRKEGRKDGRKSSGADSLEDLRAELNALWDELRGAARAAAWHF
jgi:hypothetical protein